MSEGPANRRFQFSIVRVLAATFFVACGCWAWPVELRDEDTLLGVFFWAAMKWVSPLMAVGAMFGRTRYAAAVGLAGVSLWLGYGLLRMQGLL